MAVEKNVALTVTTTSSAPSDEVRLQQDSNKGIASGRQNFKPMFENNITVEAIPLRQSNLTLSKFDERMPYSIHDSKSATYNRALKSSSQTQQGRLAKVAIRRGSYDERMLPSRPRLSTIHHVPPGQHNSQTSVEGPQNGKNSRKASDPSLNTLGGNGTSSILQEMVTRRRHLMHMIAGISGVAFVTGCVITAVCFSSGNSNLLAGQVLGVLMFVGGGCGFIAAAIHLSKPDKELQKKIERREKMFSTFKEIAYQKEERCSPSQQNEKLVARIDAAGDDRATKQT